jgi:hypothetical protein
MTALPTWLQVVYYFLLGVGALAGWGFVIRYMMTFKWYTTELGRHLITFSTCVSAWFLYFLIILIWPDLPGKTAIRTILFVALDFAIVWRLVMFERLRRNPKN